MEDTDCTHAVVGVTDGRHSCYVLRELSRYFEVESEAGEESNYVFWNTRQELETTIVVVDMSCG